MNQKVVWPAVAILATFIAGAEAVMLWYKPSPEQREAAAKKFRKDCTDQLLSKPGMPVNIAVDSCACGEREFDSTGSEAKGMEAAAKCIDPDRAIE